MDVADEIKEALRRQMGAARYELWFGHGVSLQADDDGVTVTTDSLFAAERLRSRHISDVRRAAQTVCGSQIQVRIVHAEPAASPVAAGSATSSEAAENPTIKLSAAPARAHGHERRTRSGKVASARAAIARIAAVTASRVAAAQGPLRQR